MIVGAKTPEGEPNSMVLGNPPHDRPAVIRIRNLKTKFGPKEIHHHLALDVFKGQGSTGYAAEDDQSENVFWGSPRPVDFFDHRAVRE